MTFPILASLLVRLVVLLPFQLLRLSLATPSRWTPLALSVLLHCVVALLLTLLLTFLLVMSLIVTFMVNSGFFFQAEDGIRDVAVTGVQTCALPIFIGAQQMPFKAHAWVEVDGRVVNDKSYTPELYAVLDRC